MLWFDSTLTNILQFNLLVVKLFGPKKHNWSLTSPTRAEVHCGHFEVQWGASWVGLQNYQSKLEWSCTRWSTTDSDQFHRGEIEVHRGGGRVGLQFHRGGLDLELHRDEEEEKYIEVKLKSNEAVAELDFNFAEMYLFLLLWVQLQCNVDELDLSSLWVNIALESTLVHWVQLQ